ncbi:hypothetical protein [Paenibacillus hexagrammi]|uniref:Uncharacterized protein n=1 Tax=Paenibacillus hexagrammi TaxID=2908839 RepID=A0ABY3SPH2_9BACL|nr:hypothetical protein [Paenibacillus sp. YPD9-1]UJF35599.1 hypothetical protein L0M14_11165 [Paenibacillus sp. YPD9-1]
MLGVNLRSQHLALYSIKGCRKRDYPPVFNYNTSWWKYNFIVEDYFARLSSVLTEGRPVRDVLVLHPSSTAWSMVGTGPYGFPARGKDRDVSHTNSFGHAFNTFLGKLLRAHYDFDLGDETIMAETGDVQDGLIAVNLAKYKVVVIPRIRTMLESTYWLLLRFLNSGGCAVAVGHRASMIEGRPSNLVAGLYDHSNMTVVENDDEVAAALERILPRCVSLTDMDARECPEMLYMLRDMGEKQALFIVNNDREDEHRVHIALALPNDGHMEEWSALTGEVKEVSTSFTDGLVQFEDVFGPADSKLYIWHKDRPAQSRIADAEHRPAKDQVTKKMLELGPIRKFTRTKPNVLTLDTCSFAMEDSAWSDEMEVWQAVRAIREMLNMRQIYANGIEQRYKWIHEPHPQDGRQIVFRFSFQVSDEPKEPMYLIMESAKDFEIHLNGEPVPNRSEGWFLDRSFDQVQLRGIKKGINILTLTCQYRNCMEVEDIYLTGNFGVDAGRMITAEPQTLGFGDWCLQGYPHYCGSMIYHFDVQVEPEADSRIVLELGDYSAVTVEVRVNDRTAGHVPWRAANRLDVTPFMCDGRNRIDIEVMGSPRNMLGPFHQKAGDTSTTSWASFRKEGMDHTPAYQLRPYGLFGPIQLYTEKGKGG